MTREYFMHKTVGQFLVGFSNLTSLYATGTSGTLKTGLNLLSRFTKLLSFTDMGCKFTSDTLEYDQGTTKFLSGRLSYGEMAHHLSGVIGSFVLSAAGLGDEYMGWKKQGHMGKFASAGYIYYKLSNSSKLQEDKKLQFLNSKIPLTHIDSFAATVSFGTLMASYMMGARDAIDASNARMGELSKLSKEICEVTDGQIDPYPTFYTGIVMNTGIGTVRQFCNDYGVESGPPLNELTKNALHVGMSMSVGSGIVDGLSSHIYNTVAEKLLKCDQKTFDRLRSNRETADILDQLPHLLLKASHVIEKTSVNLSLKSSWEQMLAGQAGNTGFHALVVTNLINNLGRQKTYKQMQSKMSNFDLQASDFKDVVKSGNLSKLKLAVQEILTCQENSNGGTFNDLYHGALTVVQTVASALLVALMDNKGIPYSRYELKEVKKLPFQPVVAAKFAGGSYIDEGAYAVSRLKILFDAIDNPLQTDNKSHDSGMCHPEWEPEVHITAHQAPIQD